MKYDELIQKLLKVNLFGGMKLGLENMLQLNKALNYPVDQFQTVHVAGSNGKGSVTNKIAAAYKSAGYRVGIYTSPHISCFRERIRINEGMIPEEAVERHLPEIFTIADQNHLKPTFFEITTLLAFCYFANEKVDVAIIETGLGGRYDATNIIVPKLSVVTSISLEHTDILGTTIEAIAFEKSGIIKAGVPIVLGPRLPRHVFQSCASKMDSPCICVQGDFEDYEAENNAVAKACLQVLGFKDQDIVAGLKAKLPCRFEIIEKQVPVILDVAHNPDGLLYLFKVVRAKFPNKNIRIIFGLSKTKDIPKCLSILTQNSDCLYLVEAPNGRGQPVMQLKEQLLAMGVLDKYINIAPNIQESVNSALSQSKKHDVIVVCGTFFIMSELRAALGIIEPCDVNDINER